MNWTQDLRYALRTMRRQPWFSAAIVLTILLGIGANTTVFTLVNAALFKPLPFPGGDRLVFAGASDRSHGHDFVNVSLPDLRDFRAAQHSFERMEPFAGAQILLSDNGNAPTRLRGGEIGSGLFEMLHTPPVLGRGFNADDEKAGATQVILLGHGVWSDRYNRDPNVIGKPVRVNDKSAVIVGVMPPGFKFPNNEDAWIPAISAPDKEKRDYRNYRIIGMLRPGIGIAAATADLDVIAQRLAKQYPDAEKGLGATVQTFHQVMNGGPIRLVFLLMMGAVGFVLLIACANVANMLLSRSVARSREMSIRAAIGAGRWRIARQLLIESIVLSVAGGVLGLGLAAAGAHAFSLAVADVGKPYWVEFTMDYVVFGYFAVVTILAGIIFGTAPALKAMKTDLNDGLKEGARSSAGPRGGWISGALVSFQFALAVVLLSGAGLLIRSLLHARDEFTFEPATRTLHARLNLGKDKYPDAASRIRFYDQLFPRLSAMPGTMAVAAVSDTPGQGGNRQKFEIEGKPVTEPARRPQALLVTTTPGYLTVLGVKPLRGRDFVETDGLPGKEVVLISRQFAAKFFPGKDAMGQRLRFFKDGADGAPRPWMTVTGVVDRLQQANPGDPSNDPTVLVPYRFESNSGMALLVRTSAAADRAGHAVRQQVRNLDSDLALSNVESFETTLGRGYWHLRVFGTVFSIFAFIALGMAGVGLYAVIAHATVRRTREIGVRIALGASPGSVQRLVLRRGLAQLGVGLAVGLAGAVAVCGLMQRLLFGVSPKDPLTFTLVCGAMVTVGLAACAIPARRSSRLDPLQALRHE